MRAVEAFAALVEAGDQAPTDVVRRVTGRAAEPFESYAAAASSRGAWLG